jgi:hypothetical protein
MNGSQKIRQSDEWFAKKKSNETNENGFREQVLESLMKTVVLTHD